MPYKDKERTKECDHAYYSAHREERLEYQRAYRLTHRDEVIERKRQYYLTHREEILEDQKEYYYAHYDEVREQHREYRLAHREEIRERDRTYYLAYHEEIREREKILYQRRKSNRLCVECGNPVSPGVTKCLHCLLKSCQRTLRYYHNHPMKTHLKAQQRLLRWRNERRCLGCGAPLLVPEDDSHVNCVNCRTKRQRPVGGFGEVNYKATT